MLRFQNNVKALTNVKAVPDGDPFISNVGLLLHLDTNFVDSSPNPKTVTPVGTAAISAANPRFGAGSVLLNGTGASRDHLTVAGNTDLTFGTGDFTFELWLYQTNTTSYNVFTFATQQWCVYFSTGPQSLRFWDGSSDRILGGAVSINAWHHIALTRSGTSVRLYLDGNQTGSTYTDTGPTNLTQATTYIGFYPADVSVNGNIDEVRITKGVARYTSASYIIPSLPFPNN